MDVYRLLGSLAESLRESATTEKVYGEPLEDYGKTITPTARIAYGLGRGFGKERPMTKRAEKRSVRPAKVVAEGLRWVR